MKKHYNILILFILIPFLGFSNDDTFISKEKNIKKTFIVNSNAGIDIENKYGNITVSTWDENKIDLDITIKVSGGNENWVNERLNSIDVDINALKSMVTAITNIGNSSLKSRGSSNSFEINYVIKIPKNGTVKLNNKYGNITTLTLESTTDIACKYGKIILGKLNGDSNRIEIGYSQNSSIDYIKNGNIEARYSGIKINESGNLNLDANYTDVSLLEGQNIKCKGNYGSFKFQKINSLIGSSNYVTISVAEILNSLSVDATYSKINVDSMSEKSKNVNINTGYTNISLGYDANYSFDFDINTRYGSIKNDSSLEVLVSEIKSNTKRISGYNKKKGQNKVIINSSYGNVILTKR
ncbi:hypothetical protein FLA105534_04672 [Flavobacterium bizetiae]|uniref:Adhesin domain-containing protein n=1 Tax=Flavobacterium bizetiae TaxID=2704140 RepID=A0A6J4GX79_9FLAO|nr:hypothetical protein [Flavobacterium bizetiae]CAA9203485.1 hypothetical protein FLA105534_04672 [Flavobacterium bizetiae]CAD5344810.1 hypothetical protein FLA105535_04822 [Flavobacterium bizetiae]CAD5350890.1 hypothetical protein FLA105534_04885 [Flavobacterium bizetiae]